MAMARVRRCRSGNTERMRASVDGMIVAPLIPSRARAAISSSGEAANAASSDDSPNPTEPIIRRRLRPMRSARLPITTSRPDRVNE
jgi:hypothetical protein